MEEYLRNPEVVPTCGPYLMTISNHVRYESWTKVTGKVDRISCLPAKAGTNAEYDEEEAEWSKRTSTDVSLVLECVDHEHEKSAGDELGEKHSGLGHEFSRVSAEDAGCDENQFVLPVAG